VLLCAPAVVGLEALVGAVRCVLGHVDVFTVRCESKTRGGGEKKLIDRN
jgi:hypothetical protein